MEKFIHQLNWEMFRLQNHNSIMNTKKFQDVYQEKDFVLNFNPLMILKYRFVRKIRKKLQKQKKDTTSILHFIPITFSSTSVKTPMPSRRASRIFRGLESKL